MKYWNKIVLSLTLFVSMAFVSCDTDNEGALYESEQGVSFVSSTLPAVTVSANDPTFTIDVFRSLTTEALTGSVSIVAKVGNNELVGCTASDYSFAVGEGKTQITINVAPLEVNTVLNVTLTLNGNKAIGGTATTSLKVSKDYNWLSLGTGTYTDNWGWGITYNVEIQKAEGYDRYRVIAPYEESMKNDDGEWAEWLATSSAPYVEFYTENDVVFFNPIWLGLYYEGDSSQEIWAYHPNSFSNMATPDKWTFNKWIDAKTVQLAPYYYINGIGGWDNTQKNNTIIITLP